MSWSMKGLFSGSKRHPDEGKFVTPSYTSHDVAIPDDYLRVAPDDASPITYKEIDWSTSPLPENEGRWAAVLDGVLSPSECAELLRLVEASVVGDGEPWRPALVSAGPGIEVRITDYRNSDRIIWDTQEIMDRLWGRLSSVPALREKLATVSDEWDFSRVNERGRFLKYGPGQFFKPHCDGPYYEEKGGLMYLTFYTIQLYLNDSVEAFDSPEEAKAAGATLEGGATAFLSRKTDARLPVHPKCGRVLLFQHDGLYHAGEEVKKGVKYTMRTDVLYVERRK